MKTCFFIIISSLLFLHSCKENKPSPFGQELLNTLLEAKDSLIGNKEKQLLSIEFYNHDECEIGCIIKIFSSECYASGYVDAFSEIDNTTVAIYNIRDDFYETINKNAITFFTDTINGYRDTCVMFQTNEKIFYSIHKSDSITLLHYPFDDFPNYKALRFPKCRSGVVFTIPEVYWFFIDSLQAEKDVRYYRNRRKFNKDELSDTSRYVMFYELPNLNSD